jgi:hypothetical protein
MWIKTQDGLLTLATWWDAIRINPENPKNVQLRSENDEVLGLATYTTKKRALDLYGAINEGIMYDVRLFNIPQWDDAQSA